MKRWLARLPGWLFFWVMMLGSVFITLASLVYFDTDRLAPFVIEKLPLRFETLWLHSLRVHVASALVAFPSCLLLMTRGLQRRKQIHRWLGRVTGVVVLGALVPSGVVLSLEAKGGAAGALGFLLSALIVSVGMYAGVVSARRKQLARHAYAMRHVVAQMSVAVTSRAMLVALNVAGMQPDTAYLVALWVPVIGSACVVELTSGRPLLSNLPSIHHLMPRSLR